MFGFFRAMLAIWVMAFHLVGIPVIGEYAVFSFFVLSGFLMTTIMHETYGYHASGIKKYALNRFLRLYPMYWVTISLSILTILYVGHEYSTTYKEVLYIPYNLEMIASNLLMIFPQPVFYPFALEPRLSPPTWALTIEIFFYICIALGLSKNKTITKIWVSLSVSFFIYTYILGFSNYHRYSTILAGSLPFSLGALLFFYKKEIFKLLSAYKLSNPYIITIIYIVNAALFTFNDYFNPLHLPAELSELGKYSNILLTTMIITSLFYRGEEIFSKKFDKVVGNYSYPIYLIHWQCGLIASFILFDTPSKGLSSNGILSFLLAAILTILFSSILIKTIDKNISAIRNKIK